MDKDNLLSRASEVALTGENSEISQDDNVTRERFVVFLDIMGFKDIVRSNPKHDELKKRLGELNDSINKLIKEEEATSIIELVQFSDSIILFTKNNTNEQLVKLVSIVCLIMQEAIELKFAMKGAIAKGVLTCDSNKKVYFGQAQIDAYLLEENVWYYGIVVHHSAQSDVEKINKNYISTLELPMKTGRIKHCELSWYAYSSDKANDIKERISNIRYTVSDAPRRYIDNTEAVMKAFEEKAQKKN